MKQWMNQSTLWCATLWTLSWILLIACSDPAAGPAGGVAAATAVEDRDPMQPALHMRQQKGRPLSMDLSRLVQHQRLGFRSSNNGFSGGDETYQVHVIDGRATLRPYDFSQADRGRGPVHQTVAGAATSQVARQEGSPLTVETIEILRGDVPVAATKPVAVVNREGDLELQRGVVLERWRNGLDGAEQSWTFSAPPSGQGDLVVRVAVSGQRYRGTSDQGLHFVGTQHGLGFRYGHGVWISANGSRVSVNARWRGGQLELRVPESVVGTTVFPATLDPVIGPEFVEFELDERVATPSSGLQPAVAAGPDGKSLVMWYGYGGIYGSLLDETGSVLKSGINISSIGSHPAAAYDGTNWLVVWAESQDMVECIMGARVSPSGTLLDPNPIVISADPTWPYNRIPSVSYNGTYWLVVSGQRNGTPDINVYGARIQSDGTVLDPEGIAISTGAGSPSDVAHDGQNWLVVWTESDGIYGKRVSTAGVVLDPDGFLITSSGGGAQVAYDGTNWLVVWRDTREYFWSVHGARVTPQGAVLEPNGIAIAAQNGYGPMLPDVDFDGTNWFVVWVDNISPTTEFRGARITSAGEVLDPDGFIFHVGNELEREPAVAFNGVNHQVVWHDDSRELDRYGIYGTAVSPDGTVLDPAGIGISIGWNTQNWPSASHDGTNWLVVWGDSRSRGVSGTDLYAARIDASGTVLDPGAIAISTAVQSQVFPFASSNGTHWLVVWSDDRNTPTPGTDLYGARIDATGGVLDPEGVVIAASDAIMSSPSVSSDGSRWLVAWDDLILTPRTSRVFVARVDADGTVLEPGGVVVSGDGQAFDPAISYDGTNWLVVYQTKLPGKEDDDIYATRINREGVALDPSGIAIFDGPNSQGQPSVSHDGTQWLVTWHTVSRTEIGSQSDVYGARISSGGIVLDPDGIPISTGADEWYSATAYDGKDWLVAWTDRSTPRTASISGARVNSTGLVLDASGIQLSEAVDPNGTPALSAGNDRKMLLAYVARNSRVYARVLTPECTEADESCDGFDDDCDGEVDENYAPVVTSCGVGACSAAGATTCAEGDVLDSCTPAAPAGDDSSCDGIDDDCDGEVDEEYAPVVTTCGAGACAASGTTRCAEGTVLDSCTPAAPVEDDSSCDGFDDDCDGEVDEDYAPVVTSCGVGACSAAGATTCAEGTVLDSCTPAAPVGDDSSCDGIDDDCDGEVDEEYAPVVTTCGAGACAASGTTRCAEGTLLDSCTPAAPVGDDSSCDGIDDDCDDEVDEDYAPVVTSCGAGACAASGTTRCAEGTVLDSCTPAAPAGDDSSCDGIDDDCDGEVDEDYSPVETTCGVGACSAVGKTFCDEGEVTDSCTVDMTDSDDDGVSDCLDACPDQPGDNPNGCADSESPPGGEKEGCSCSAPGSSRALGNGTWVALLVAGMGLKRRASRTRPGGRLPRTLSTL